MIMIIIYLKLIYTAKATSTIFSEPFNLPRVLAPKTNWTVNKPASGGGRVTGRALALTCTLPGWCFHGTVSGSILILYPAPQLWRANRHHSSGGQTGITALAGKQASQLWRANRTECRDPLTKQTACRNFLLLEVHVKYLKAFWI